MHGNAQEYSSFFFLLSTSSTKGTSLHEKRDFSKLLVHPHKQKYTEMSIKRSTTCGLVFFLGRYTCAERERERDDPRNTAASSKFHSIVSEKAAAHLSAVRRLSARCRSSVRAVAPGSRTVVIRMLVDRQAQLRAAAVGAWIHLPTRDQVGLQPWMER